MNFSKTLPALYVLSAICATSVAAAEKSLVDYFLPMEPQAPLVSEGIWGDPNVLPRDIKNGLEDPEMTRFCYWDGGVVKDDDGRFHLYASRWDQSLSHSEGWHLGSKGIHAVSNDIMGPYVDEGLAYPQWREGMGHNVMGLRMHDGRYAIVTSEITHGEVFVSDSPDGPFELLGQIKWDANGFDPGLARYNQNGRMSNVKILLRPDGKYMIIARSTAPMLSEDGILGPYKIMGDRVYRNYPELPQEKNEDPTVWYSGGLYHIVYNHWPSKTSHHFTSEDGINDWKYRGIAFKKDETKIFRYKDGTINDWTYVERPTAVVEDGHVSHFLFSVIDVGKGQDRANDRHGSKIVVVPFDGVAFDRDMQSRISRESTNQ
ncbi:glycoside hydrolase family protein [Luteolibacter algae]|uniref:Glycoside hydrolase family protein n=1 Tax=Luteolibacter algae TaxID=454151 RepID=A0ABW5D2D8_9BACT